MRYWPKLLTFVVMIVLGASAMNCVLHAETVDEAYAKEISNGDVALKEVEAFLESRVIRMPNVTSSAEWDGKAKEIREQTLQRVIYRGEAARWRDASANVEWFDSIEGGPGYRIRKLRFEAIPGMWIPALLYEPTNVTGRVPVALNVNGHDANGKAADYKQIRCINQAKRGMIVLNPEWFNMGQLRSEGYAHSRLNQVDLCGTSGLAPFYLSMKRSLDILLSHPNADPTRVAVAGLSGGGWQTILISSLDTRVTLTNPVAGYSSFITRIHNHSDLGDSEQTPVDLGAVADYSLLTCMMAPRATLLTYNVKDNCCFASAHALPPLMQVSEPIFKLYGKPEKLRSHVNHDPGTHNFEKDNRQALYRMIGDNFYPGESAFPKDEIECAAEVKTAEQLAVPFPAQNETLHSLAVRLSTALPHDAELPKTRESAQTWSDAKRKALKDLVAAKDYSVSAQVVGDAKVGDLQFTYWRLKLADAWTVPAVEIAKGTPTNSTTIVVHDGGRKSAKESVLKLVDAGHRVVAIDPFYFGESAFANRPYLWGLFVSTVGERPIGVQASQVAAVARWLRNDRSIADVSVRSFGPRSSLFSLIATAIEPQSISACRCTDSLGSLKEILERDWTADQYPELFCFGLLEQFDIRQLVALSAPRAVTFDQPSDRVRRELADLKGYFELRGSAVSPVE